MDVMGRFIYILVDVYNRAHNHHVWLMYMDVDVIDMLGIQTTGPQTTNSPLVDQLIQKKNVKLDHLLSFYPRFWENKCNIRLTLGNQQNLY